MTRLAALVLVALLATACNPEGAKAPPAGTTATSGTSDTGKPSGVLTKPLTMPSLVGQNLQAAKDAMKKLTGDPLFLVSSHDVAQHRQPILSHDWQVCTQAPAAGSQFTIKNSVIDLGVVRTDEKCP